MIFSSDGKRLYCRRKGENKKTKYNQLQVVGVDGETVAVIDTQRDIYSFDVDPNETYAAISKCPSGIEYMHRRAIIRDNQGAGRMPLEC